MLKKICRYWGCDTMWIDNAIFKEDLEYILKYKAIDWNQLKNKTILITGANGLIGSTLVKALIYANYKIGLRIKIIALVRNVEKAEKVFENQLNQYESLEFIIGDVESLPEVPMDIDYIVHAASPTASSYFIEKPVETIRASVRGTYNLLELAINKNVSSFVYLSSMEVYGSPNSDTIISENHGTNVDTMSVRSCYPEAKRLCEVMCTSFANEYQLPAKVIRLAQTFGPGVLANDQRVFAEFARCAKEGKDIVLNSLGTSKRCSLYTADAITAILLVLLRGRVANAYNAANPKTYCSIYEMGNIVAEKLTNSRIKVLTSVDEQRCKRYPPPYKLNLGIRKLQELGWEPYFDLPEMYRRMIEGME